MKMTSTRWASARAVAWATAALALLAAQTAHAGCKPTCAGVTGVVHAAGVPSDLKQALARLEFNGPALAAGDAQVVKDIVRALAALPAGTRVSLNTRADSGLTGGAATRQAQARAEALNKAVLAGLKAGGGKEAVLKGVEAAK